MRFVKFFSLVVLLLTLFTPQAILAQGESFEVRYERVNPDTPLAYRLKRLAEKVILFLKFSPEGKVDYYHALLDRRLAELKYITENKNRAYIETVSSRYAATAGQLTDLIISKNVTTKKEKTTEFFIKHKNLIDSFKDNWAYNTAEWRFVMNDINSLDIYTKQLVSMP